MRIYKTHEFDSRKLSSSENLWIYNGIDNCITYEVLEALLPQLTPTTAATYAFSCDLQGPILEMNMRGMLVDESRRQETLASYRMDIIRLTEQLNTLIRDGIGWQFEISKNRKYSWPSDDQLKTLFFEVMKLPIQRKRNAQGEWVPTVDRDALEKLEHYFYAEPIVRHLYALRELAKKVSFLSTAVDPDGRMRTSFNIAGTTTGRLASSFSEFGTGCVRPTAEALTPLGWRPLSEIKDGDIIAQWQQWGAVEFVPCKMFRTPFAGNLLRVKSEQIDLAVTPDHRVVYSTYYDSVYKSAPAKAVKGSRQIKIPLGGINNEGTLSYPAYLVMMMADFSKEETGWRGSFKKTRKIERFLQLAKEFGFAYTEQKAAEGYRRFYIPGHIDWPKDWSDWVISLTAESAEALLEEARYWDSHSRGNAFIFYTAEKHQAEWFAVLAHLAGKSTTTRVTEQHPNSYSTTTMYCVNVKNRDHAQVLHKHWSTLPYEGEVCCPSVPSTFWLVRENGYISVTGNTNLQNVENRLRAVFVADPGYKFCNIDLEQGDSRGVGAIHWNLFRDGRYLDACESGDLHTTVARGAFPLNWTGDLALDRSRADGKFYREFSYRDAAKRLGHGSNYQGQAEKMSKATHIPIDQVKAFQAKYLKTYPAFEHWWQWVERQIRDVRKITTLLGRQRYFFGHWKDPDTIRAAIAYEPQSITADTIDRGLLALWCANRVQLLLQVHDSILFQFPEELEDEIVPWALRTIEQRQMLKEGREFVIPGEAKVGWNWSDLKDDPDALRKYSDPSRPRQRTRNPATFRSLCAA